MFKSLKELMDLGYHLMESLHSHFLGSEFESDVYENEHQSLIVTGGIRFAFRRWGDKPTYIILFKGAKYVYELDLSRIIESNDRFTWLLSRPSHTENKKLLDKLYKWNTKVELSYRDSLIKQKKDLHAGYKVQQGGYSFVTNSSWEELEVSFLDLVDNVINLHLGKAPISTKSIYNIDDARAIEGYQTDKRYLLTKRNQSIVEKRKQKDNHTCQVCGFHMQINGRYIIECHHTKPLAGGESRITNIDDLVCLCPTCHRISHTRNPQFSVVEMKTLRKHIVRGA